MFQHAADRAARGSYDDFTRPDPKRVLRRRRRRTDDRRDESHRDLLKVQIVEGDAISNRRL
jgi:IS5 family transposase